MIARPQNYKDPRQNNIVTKNKSEPELDMPEMSLDKSKIRFLLLEGVHPSAVQMLKASGYSNIEYLKTALCAQQLKEKVADAHFLGIRSNTRLTEDVFAAANRLCAVGCFCIGTNQVDLDAASLRGIPVFNAPYSNTRSVAELVLAEAILLMRGVPQKNALAHRGKWLKSASNAYEIRGKKLGIVGYGNIGSQLSIMAESLGMEVCFYDVATRLPMGNATQVSSLNELLRIADIVSLHVPENPGTEWMFGEEQFELMKKDSILINASRGSVVVIESLAEHLKSGKLLGAAVDVFPQEPKSNADEFLSPLRGIDNVLLTPHVGGSTQEAQQNIGREVAEKFIQYSDIGSTLSSVNFPQVALPSYPGKHRLLHIHHNIPGVLGKINQIFSENNINISGQYLQTNDRVGYVVIDVEASHSEIALDKLRHIEGTIRCRVLY